MNVLIIGGSSFIGTYLIEQLVQSSAFSGKIVATGRNERFKKIYEKLGVPYVYVDVCDESTLENLREYDFDVVVLCAALMPANVSGIDKYQDLMSFYQVNLLGTIKVLEFCRKNNIPRVISFGTKNDCRLYGEDEVITEQTPLNFSYTDDHAAYVMSYKAKWDVMNFYNQNYNMKNVLLRLPMVFGVGPHGGLYQDGVYRKSGLQIFIDKAQKGEPIEVYGNVNVKKDLLYVKDLALEIQKIIYDTKKRGFYNIGYDKNFTLMEIVEAIVETFSPKDARSDILLRPEMKNNGGSCEMDVTKLKREIGFEPMFSNLESIMDDYKKELKRGFYTELFAERYNG